MCSCELVTAVSIWLAHQYFCAWRGAWLGVQDQLGGGGGRVCVCVCVCVCECLGGGRKYFAARPDKLARGGGGGGGGLVYIIFYRADKKFLYDNIPITDARSKRFEKRSLPEYQVDLPKYYPFCQNIASWKILRALQPPPPPRKLILPYFGKKEASDIPSKSELLMILYFTQCALLPSQISCINAQPDKRYVR